MKSILTLLLAFIALSSLGQFVERKNPFEGSKYQSDSDFIRATTHKFGKTSPDILKKIASMDARVEMRSQVKISIKSTVKNVIKGFGINDSLTFDTRFEEKIENCTQGIIEGSFIKEFKEFENRRKGIWDVWVFLECDRNLNQVSSTEIEGIRQELPEDIREKITAETFEQRFRIEFRKN